MHLHIHTQQGSPFTLPSLLSTLSSKEKKKKKKLSPTHGNLAPVHCLLHLVDLAPAPPPGRFETANRSPVHLAVIVQLSGDRYASSLLGLGGMLV